MDTTNTPQALQIHKEQVYLLYKLSFNAAIATAVAACVLTYVQWHHISHATLVSWLSFMSIIIIIRVTFYITFHQKQPAAQDIPFWEKSHVFLSIGAGLAWGSAGIFLLPENNFECQAATIILLAGMAAGSITTLSALRAPVFIFLF